MKNQRAANTKTRKIYISFPQKIKSKQSEIQSRKLSRQVKNQRKIRISQCYEETDIRVRIHVKIDEQVLTSRVRSQLWFSFFHLWEREKEKVRERERDLVWVGKWQWLEVSSRKPFFALRAQLKNKNPFHSHRFCVLLYTVEKWPHPFLFLLFITNA